MYNKCVQKSAWKIEECLENKSKEGEKGFTHQEDQQAASQSLLEFLLLD